MCASSADMEFSMLKYSKELFEYTHDVQTARNIIALLYKRNETRKEEYEPYLVPLTETEDPRILMAASSALWKLGKYDDADFYAYKALYNLNGKDVSISMSFGAAYGTELVSNLIKTADSALYESKRTRDAYTVIEI